MSRELFDVTVFGAIGDGKTLNTLAIQKTIRACFESGGGVVSFPPGVYLTGTIELLSHVTLELSAGATLLGSPNIADYPHTPYSSEGRDNALILAVGAHNIAITGRGAVDGNGRTFMKTEPLVYDSFIKGCTRQGDHYQTGAEAYKDGPVDMHDRPGVLMLFINCTNLLVRDIAVLDAPNWCLHLAGCQHADLVEIDIRNSLLIPNSGGFDVSNSRNVNIAHCDIECGDDGIAISPCADGYSSQTCENITVTNCMIVSRSAAVRLGWGEHNIRNIVLQNLIIRNSNRGILINVRQDQIIENILFSNIIIETRLHAGNWWGMAEPIHLSVIPFSANSRTGVIRHVRFSNIIAESENGIVIYGHQAGDIQDVSFWDVRLRLHDSPLGESCGGNFDLRLAWPSEYNVFKHDIPGLYARGIDGLQIHGFYLEWADMLPEFFSYGIQCEHFKDLEIDAFRGRQALRGSTGTAIVLQDGSGVSITNCRAEEGTGTFLSVFNVTCQGLFVNNDLSQARHALAPAVTDFQMYGNFLPIPPSEG